VHHAHLRIDKPLTLVGGPDAVLDADGTGDVVRIVAPHVTVKGLTIRDSGTDLTAMNAGIYVEKQADDAVLIGNRLEDVLFGIYLDGPAGARVIDNRIRGISSLRRADRSTLIKGNDIAATRDGIYIYISPQTRILGNRLHGVRYGVHYMYSNDDEVAGNISFGNIAGYALMQSHNLRVHDNTSNGDRDYGILLNYVTFSRFSSNRVTLVRGETGTDGTVVPGAEGKGIFVYNSEYDRFARNTIADCPIGIHVTAGSDHDVFYDNAFLHNRVQVKYVQNMKEEWSRRGVGNYWSDYSY